MCAPLIFDDKYYNYIIVHAKTYIVIAIAVVLCDGVGSIQTRQNNIAML